MSLDEGWGIVEMLEYVPTARKWVWGWLECCIMFVLLVGGWFVGRGQVITINSRVCGAR